MSDQQPPEATGLPPVAVAGASGFIGTALCEALAGEHEVIGLGRGAAPEGSAAASWRTCDLFSLQEMEKALEGVEFAVYLVHSMLPSARLTQSSFADLDLLLADNFARAAERAGVQRILYVGGFVPETDALSPHLSSRFEVERILGSRSPRLTALRCGIVIGSGSSSFWIIHNLVRRLPVMVLPKWTDSRTQPVALVDLLRAIQHCLEEPSTESRSFDVGGAEVLTYRALMERVAKVMDRRPWLVGTRFFSPRFSRLWVTLFGSAPPSLVRPLIESLRHDMVARPNPLQAWLAPEAVGLDEAIRIALQGDSSRRTASVPVTLIRRAAILRGMRSDRRARSVQRLPLPKGRDAVWAAREYLRFLPRWARGLIRVTADPSGDCRVMLFGTKWVLLHLVLSRERSTEARQVFDVVGGWLTRKAAGDRGRLEFRVVESQLLVAVHDFAPSLPWLLYEQVQARVHLAVMNAFGRWLGSQPAPARRES